VRRVVLGLSLLSDSLFREEPDTVTVLGASVPRRLSSEDDERLETAGLLPAPWERRIAVTGRDAARFLHNMLTQDVNGMPVSSVRPVALADRKGHPIAEGQLWREEPERFVLRIAAPFVPVLLDVFDRHRIMERVEWSVPPPGVPFLLAGPRAATVLGGEGAEAGKLPELGVDACWIRVREITPFDRVIFGAVPFPTASAWLSGALPVGWDAFDRARIDAGRAWMGLDVDSERLVPEPGWDDHISYAKGCYLGQETLARLHYQGRLNWGLARLRWSGPPVPRGSELRDSGSAGRLGWVTSIQPDESGCRALGFLHRRAREEAIELFLPDGRPVTEVPSDGGSMRNY
jgi:folate-binding protein YgfZ